MPGTLAPLARLCMLVIAFLILTTSVLAQSQATTGNIEGRVLDPKGAVVPGVSVTAHNQATGFEKVPRPIRMETTKSCCCLPGRMQ